MKHLYHLKKYFWNNKVRFGLGIFFTLLSNYFGVLSPQVTKYIINKVEDFISKQPNTEISGFTQYDPVVQKLLVYINTHISFSNIIVYCGLLLILLALLKGFFTFLMRQTIIVMSRHIEFDQKNDIYNHYQKLDSLFYKKNSTGDLMNRISEDVSKVRMFTGPAVMYTTNLIALIGLSVYYMIQLNPFLTLFTLLPLPILAFIIYKVNTIISKKSELQQEKLSLLTTNAQESYSGIRVIKSFVQENALGKVFTKNSEDYKQAAISLSKTEAWYFPSIALLIGLSTLITIMVAGILKSTGDSSISAGTIAAFVVFVNMLSFPVSSIGWVASIIQKASTSQKRINQFLLEQPHIQNEGRLLIENGIDEIAFKNIHFTYPDTGIQAIKNMSFKIAKNEKVAIVGKTGSGKSTLVQLMLNVLKPDKGEIYFNQKPNSQYDLFQLRSKISYVPQEVFLFSDTIQQNICFGLDTIDQAKVEAASKVAMIYDEINEFTDQFQTIVGERGVTLSGGQKQRISIARALVKSSDLYIFDDCLSAVDIKTESAILHNLAQSLQNKTALFVTHRLFGLMQFDKIIVMKNGEIIETGTHADLLYKKGYYFDLYNEQQYQNN